MDIDKIKRKPKPETVQISIRIPKSASKFMRDKNYSPTGIFLEALKDLGWKSGTE